MGCRFYEDKTMTTELSIEWEGIKRQESIIRARIKEIKMYLKWLSLSCIVSVVILSTSWVWGESITASNSPVANQQSQNTQNKAVNDSVYVEKITFYSERSGNAEVYIMNADGTGLKRLTVNSAQDNCPDISPDGKKIAFSSNRDGNYEIYIMNIDGSSQQRLTNTPYNELHADWSPDGTRIYYLEDMGVNAAICVMNADGSGDTTLTSGTVRDVRPNVSPDGNKIVFNSTRDGNFEIYFMNIDGSNQQRLTNSSDWEVFPAW
jgi:Tol biopolymer transport system component